MAKTERQGGRYRKMLLEQQGQAPQEEEPSAGWVFFRIRFYTCICLFVAYVILDYTKASVVSVDSSRIYAEIERDLAEDFDLEEAWSKAVESVRISGAEDEENERETEKNRKQINREQMNRRQNNWKQMKSFPSPDKMKK